MKKILLALSFLGLHSGQAISKEVPKQKVAIQRAIAQKAIADKAAAVQKAAAQKAAAQKAAAQKAAVQKAAAQKAIADKAAAVQKAAAQKAIADKAAAVQKAAAQKAAAQKAIADKAAAVQKAAADKAAADKAVAEQKAIAVQKAAADKAVAEQKAIAVQKAAADKAAADKAAAQKAIADKAIAEQKEKDRKISSLFNGLSVNTLNKDQKDVAARWMALNEPPLTPQQVAAAINLIMLRQNDFTMAQLAVALTIRTLGHGNFVASQLSAGTRLASLGHNNFTQPQLTAAEGLTRLGQINFTVPQLTASARLIALGENNFTQPQLTAAEGLTRLGQINFTVPQLTASARLIALGENNFTQLQLTAAEELTRLGQVNFMAPQLTAAEDLVSTGQLNFTDVELRAAEIKCAWPNMSQEQRALAVVDSMFNDKLYRNNNGFPAAVNEQRDLKDFFINSLRGDDIRLNPLNNSYIRLNYQTVLGGIKKASMLLKYEQNFHLPRQDAKDFYDFNARYQLIAGTFPLVEEKRLALFRSLKQHLGGEDWQKVRAVLMTTLNNSLPMDHDQWPDFDRDGAANFDDFINQVISPTLAAVRASPDLENDVQARVEGLLILKDQGFQARINGKIVDYTNATNNHRIEQIGRHGAKKPLAPIETMYEKIETFAELSERLLLQLFEMGDNAERNPDLRERINYAYYCDDPFLSILRSPDQRLDVILKGNPLDPVNHPAFRPIDQEVQELKDKVLARVPADRQILNAEFDESFRRDGYGLNQNLSDCIKTVARLKRLYESITTNLGEDQAAEVIYGFGTENNERCIDGKRDRVTELERHYVYVAGGLGAGNDHDTTIGLNLAKLFTDHRTEELRKAVNALYDGGESQTYAWFKSHRALTLPFGLTGEYEDLRYGERRKECVDPSEFITRYFRGGNVSATEVRAGRNYNIQEFTVDKMVDLVLENVKKPMGGLFDDVTLDYMVNSNLAIRKAYTDFQNHVDVEAYENDFFKDPRLSLRDALKPSVIKKVLNRYSYIYERDEHDVWR